MGLPGMPPVPDSLKVLQHFLNIASEHDSRDIVISYWCRMYALQQAMKIDKSSPEAKRLLLFLMEWLEQVKKKESENEAIIHDIPAQAHIENYALKLFLFADREDRAGVFNKSVVKSFYTAGMLYTVLETFGELTEEVINNQKYAKWKAAYIHNCLKNGETPIAGPMAGEEENSGMGFVVPGAADRTKDEEMPDEPGVSGVPFGGPPAGFPTTPYEFPPSQPPAAGPSILPPGPSSLPSPAVPYNVAPVPSGGGAVNPEVITRAQKLCKYAGSALNYDDVPTAITNLQKALNLLTTGHEE